MLMPWPCEYYVIAMRNGRISLTLWNSQRDPYSAPTCLSYV
jgi:hypothetical protein